MLAYLKKFRKSRRPLAICFLLILSLFVFGRRDGVFAQEIDGEKVASFAVALKVEKDATLTVEEAIQYDFGNNKKHGIYRDIPVEYKTRLGASQSLMVSVDAVTDEKGGAYTYETSTENGHLNIKIGDKDALISGKHTYVLRYHVRYAFGYFENFDELYWNATGNGWIVPIESVSVSLQLPESLPPEKIKTSCYEGAFGSSRSCDARSNFSADTYFTRSTVPLTAGEGLTIAVGFPKGVILEPTRIERLWNFIGDNPAVILPGIVFVFMFILWYRRGRDPKGRGVIIPEYDTPDNFGALSVAGLMHNGVSSEHISAAIIELAVEGYIHIEQKPEEGSIYKKTDYVFTRTEKQSEGELANPVLRALFHEENAFGKKVKLSDLKQSFYKAIPGIEEKTLNILVREKYFLESPKIATNLYIKIGIAGLVLILVFCFAFGLFGHAISLISVVLSAVTYFIFASLMSSVTKLGALTKERILGLKEYLQIAEKNRLEFHNAPEKRPEIFEKLLPVAMILGVESAWAKEFSGMYTTPPSWYSGMPGQNFSSSALVSGLGDFRSAASSMLASAPGRSSGSGGGGFSGGGGGGGGGGSW